MATYKVLQDIEAEDKLLGPLTLKQFVFGCIAAGLIAIGFFVGRSTNMWFLLVMIILAIPFIFLAAPLGRDQPNDVWLASRLRFWFKTRRRIWDQSGMEELVTITAPPKVEKAYSDGLSREQVNSRLTALAQTLDTRGWATRHLLTAPVAVATDDDRLIRREDVYEEPAPDFEIHKDDDLFDLNTNPDAQNFEKMVEQRTKALRDEALQRMQTARLEDPVSVQANAPATNTDHPQIQTANQQPRLNSEEAEFLESRRKELRRLGVTPGSQPPAAQMSATTMPIPAKESTPQQPQSAIIDQDRVGPELRPAFNPDNGQFNDNQEISLH